MTTFQRSNPNFVAWLICLCFIHNLVPWWPALPWRWEGAVILSFVGQPPSDDTESNGPGLVGPCSDRMSLFDSASAVPVQILDRGNRTEGGQLSAPGISSGVEQTVRRTTTRTDLHEAVAKERDCIVEAERRERERERGQSQVGMNSPSDRRMLLMLMRIEDTALVTER